MTFGHLEAPLIKKQYKKDEQIEKKLDWSEEDFAVLMGNISLLKNTESYKEDPQTYEKRAHETYLELKEYLQDHGGEYIENVNDVYQKYSSATPRVVRREDPSRLVDLVNGKNIEMNFDPDVVAKRGDKYANCALWPHGPVSKTSGIANAFLEGRGAAGPIVMVAGYEFDKDHMTIEEPLEKMIKVGAISRESVKVLDGEIRPGDLEFIVLRIAPKFFSESEMTDDEKVRVENSRDAQIFRGFYFKKS